MELFLIHFCFVIFLLSYKEYGVLLLINTTLIKCFTFYIGNTYQLSMNANCVQCIWIMPYGIIISVYQCKTVENNILFLKYIY